MRAALIENLDEIKVENGNFVNSLSVFLATYSAQAKLPKSGPKVGLMEEYVDDFPFVEFVLETIRTELNQNYDYDSDSASQPLGQIAEYTNKEALADRLIDQFEKLPNKYSVAIQLPENFFPTALLDDGAKSLGEGAGIHPPDMVFQQKFPLEHPNPRIMARAKGGGLLSTLLLGNPSWKQDQFCFVTEVEGHIGIWGSGNPMARAQDLLESFIGLGLAKLLFTYSFAFDNEKVRRNFNVHQLKGDSGEFYTSVELNEDAAEVVRHVKSFKFDSDYPVDSRMPWLARQLSEIDKVFRSENGGRVILASKWFFDHYKNSDPALQYVRLMTCLEIILGEGNINQGISLGDLLSNRLAYLIGKDYSDRAKILKEFKEIYNLRSRILHQGKHRLKREERAKMTTLIGYCRKAIDAESTLLIS